MIIDVTLRGAAELAAIFDSVGSGTFMRGIATGVFAEANRIMRVSKRMIPLEDGILRGSATIYPVVISGTHWEITMGYGGAASAYALLQHENLSFHHPGLKSKRKGQTGRHAKYLSEPVRMAVPTIEARLSRSVMNYFTPFGSMSTGGNMNAGESPDVGMGQ